jgi:hypothetical protein
VKGRIAAIKSTGVAAIVEGGFGVAGVLNTVLLNALQGSIV